MIKRPDTRAQRIKRHNRVRGKISGTAERPRLSVFRSTAKEIIVPFEMEWHLKDATFFVPQRGDKKHLLELSEMNCRQYKFDRLKQAEKLNPEQKQTRLMKELQQQLAKQCFL